MKIIILIMMTVIKTMGTCQMLSMMMNKLYRIKCTNRLIPWHRFNRIQWKKNQKQIKKLRLNQNKQMFYQGCTRQSIHSKRRKLMVEKTTLFFTSLWLDLAKTIKNGGCIKDIVTLILYKNILRTLIQTYLLFLQKHISNWVIKNILKKEEKIWIIT